MKNFIASVAILALMGVAVGAAVRAAGEAGVTATVTVQNVSVSVSDGTVNYGTLATGASKDTTVSGLNDTQTAANNGNVTEDLNIRGQATAAWTLAATAGNEQYAHQFSKNGGAAWTSLTTINQTLATSTAAGGSQTFDLKILVPTATASFTQQSANVTVQATAL